jgi:hypothetical protein
MRYHHLALLAPLCLITPTAYAEIGIDPSSHVVETGTGVLCDSRTQIEKVAALDAEESAMQAINASEPKACAYAEVGFIRGASYGQVHISKHTFEVVEVLVLGFKTQGEWHQLSPIIQWTLFPIREEIA